jgi:predicted MarR family transcription regulator
MTEDNANGDEDPRIAAVPGSNLSGVKRIVSSSHLVSEKAAELSEVEYGLIVGWNAFGKWMVKAMATAVADAGMMVTGGTDLAVLDILCLHSVNHRERPKKLGDICFKLNVEDSHTVNYALKKLIKMKLVSSEKHGKEVFYATTASGVDLCLKYRAVRESCLVDGFVDFDGGKGAELGEVARQLRILSGLYDQAARSATNL